LQNVDLNRAINHSISQTDKMRNEDPEFRKLASKDNSLGIPDAAAIRINNAFDYPTAKKLLTRLLKEDGLNAQMKVNLYENNLDKWLQKLMNQEISTHKEPSDIPDLSDGSIKSDNQSNSQEMLSDYLNSKR